MLFVFAVRKHTDGPAEVFLVDSDYAFADEDAVEPLDDDGGFLAEVGEVDGGDVDPDHSGGVHRGVLDERPMMQAADVRLDDVGGSRESLRGVPLGALTHEGELLLLPGK